MTLDPRYPIGIYHPGDWEDRSANIRTIAELPAKLAEAVEGLTHEQLDEPYRPGGWSLRQTVHHIADSHMNSLCRLKFALTEDEPPTIRPYYEDRWAELADSGLPIGVSLRMIEGIHRRWSELLESMTDDQFSREFIHPETGRWTLEKMTGLYAWHSRHHTAHITETRELNGW